MERLGKGNLPGPVGRKQHRVRGNHLFAMIDNRVRGSDLISDVRRMSALRSQATSLKASKCSCSNGFFFGDIENPDKPFHP